MRLRNDRKAERIREGEERNAAWLELSDADELAILAKRPGKAARQVKKLTKGA